MATQTNGFTNDKEKVALEEWIQDYLSGGGVDIGSLVENKIKEKMLNSVYPVGAILMNTSGINPGDGDREKGVEPIGGTWALWGAGRVPVGYNGTDSDFFPAEKVGGEKRHTLTTSEMPAHTHGVRAHGTTNDSPSGTVYIKAARNSQEGSASTNSAGGGVAHNIMQPYIVCYMWKRTA